MGGGPYLVGEFDEVYGRYIELVSGYFKKQL
jgi:hypothetical protein